MASNRTAATSDTAGSGDSAAGGQLRQCALCKAPEATPGQFLACAQCRRACYCSRDCQRADYYKGHSECVVAHLHTALQSGPLDQRHIKQALKVVGNAATAQQHLQAAQLLAKATALCTHSDPGSASATWAACGLLPTIIIRLEALHHQVLQVNAFVAPPAADVMDAVDLYCLTLCWALHWPYPGESRNTKGARLLQGTSPLHTLLLGLLLVRAITPEAVAAGLCAELEWAVRSAGVMALQGYLLALQDGPAAHSGLLNNIIEANPMAGPIICRRLVQLLGQQPGCEWLPAGMAGPYGTVLVALLTATSGAGLRGSLSELYSEEAVMDVLAAAITQAGEIGSAIIAGEPNARDDLSCVQGPFESCRSPHAKALSALAALEALVKAAVDKEGWKGLDRVGRAGGGVVAKAVVSLVAAIMEQLEAADCAAGVTDQLLARALQMLAALSEVGPQGMEEALPSLLPKWLAALPLLNQECRQLALALAGVLATDELHDQWGTWLHTGGWPRVESSLMDGLTARRATIAAKVWERIDLQERVVASALVACLDACNNQHTQSLAIYLMANVLCVQPLPAQIAVPLFRAVPPNAASEEQQEWQQPPRQSDWQLPTIVTKATAMTYEVLVAIDKVLERTGDPPLVEIREFLLEMMAQPMAASAHDHDVLRMFYNVTALLIRSQPLLPPHPASCRQRYPLAPGHHNFLARLIPMLPAHVTSSPLILQHNPEAWRALSPCLAVTWELLLIFNHCSKAAPPPNSRTLPAADKVTPSTTMFDVATASGSCPPEVAPVVAAVRAHLLQRPVLLHLLKRITGIHTRGDLCRRMQAEALWLLAHSTVYMNSAQWVALLRVPGLWEVVAGLVVESERAGSAHSGARWLVGHVLTLLPRGQWAALGELLEPGRCGRLSGSWRRLCVWWQVQCVWGHNFCGTGCRG